MCDRGLTQALSEMGFQQGIGEPTTNMCGFPTDLLRMCYALPASMEKPSRKGLIITPVCCHSGGGQSVRRNGVTQGP